MRSVAGLITGAGNYLSTDTMNLSTDATGQLQQQIEVLQAKLTEKINQLEQVKSFAMHGPMPRLKISNNGQVLMANSAALALQLFELDGEHLLAEDFWPIALVKTGNTSGAIRATCQGKIFNFELKKIIAENCFLVNGYETDDKEHANANTAYNDLILKQADFITSLKNNIAAGDLQLKLAKTAGSLKALLGNMHAGVAVADEYGRITFVNRNFLELFNLPGEARDIEDNDAASLYETISRQFKSAVNFKQELNSLILQRKNVVNQRLEMADGSVFIRHFIANIGEAGEYYGHMSLYRDITDVVRLEVEIKTQKHFYENILNNLPADIVVFDNEQRYKFLNPVAIPEDDLRQWVLGKTDTEYCELRNRPQEMTDNRRRHFVEAVERKALVSYEEDITDENGITNTYLRNFYPVVDGAGNIEQVILYGIDITERKAFEQTVRVSEKRYRDLINNNQALIITHDLNGVITSINPAVENTLGFTAQEMLGAPLTSFLSDNAASTFAENYLAYLMANKKIEGVFKILSKTGERFYLLFKNMIFSEEGKEPYVIAFAQDITQRILAEKELDVSRRETEKISRSKQQFLANMSHEIRTPMNGVIGMVNLLKQTELSPQQKEYVDIINQSADNLLVIVNDILDLQKIVSGKLAPENIPFSLQEKVRMTIESFRYQAQQKKLQLHVSYNVPAGMWVMGDQFRLTQVLNNLLSNALKFTSEGSINVAVCAKPLAGDKVIAEFEVADTGKGISADRIDDIFEPYVQERSETARKYGGTGLGLPISKSLVELLGGKMEVHSIDGHGSSFKFTLPFTVCEKANVTADIALPSKELMRGKRVLVAEDVAVNQYLVRHILNNWGCVFQIANNGREAITFMEQSDWDIVLMDIQMPLMDGLEATSHIRKFQDVKKASVPIIALTANALKGDEIKYKEAGMNGYLAKPYNESSLLNVINKVINETNTGTVINMSVKAAGTAPVQETQHVGGPLLFNLAMLEDMSGGDRDFINMMADLFISTTPPLLEELMDAINHADWKLAAVAAHKIKPTIESMGIEKGAAMINEIEELAKEQYDIALIPQKANEFVATIKACMKQMRHYINNNL